jgi:small subunit ribosomal protein S3
VNIEEVRKPEIDAQLIADSITQQLEKRIMFRRAMKRAMQNAMRLGAQGIKIMSAGRLNGIEIARTEWYREGRVPLHTLRADIDYGTLRSQDHLRRDRRQGLGLQGRHPGPQRCARWTTPRPDEERRPRGPRRDARPGDRRPVTAVAAPPSGRCRQRGAGRWQRQARRSNAGADAPKTPLSASAKSPRRPLQLRTVKENKHAATRSPQSTARSRRAATPASPPGATRWHSVTSVSSPPTAAA